MADTDRLPASGHDHGLLRVKPRPLVDRETKKRHRKRWLKTGWRPEPAPSRRGVLEEPTPTSVGICCSGGGIRSAAFNLGALQALDANEALRPATYLAAVSGGSYIAASMTMVATTWPANEDARPSEKHEKGFDDSNPRLLEKEGPFARGSAEEQYLRNRCSYLAPDGSSKLFLVFRVLLGLVFNLFFLGLPLFAAGLLLGPLVYEPAYDVLDGDLTVPLWANVVVAVAVAAAVVAGGTALLARLASDSRRLAAETWTVRLAVVAAAVFVALYLIPLALEVIRDYGDRGDGQRSAAGGGLLGTAGVVSMLVAVLAQLRARISEPATVLKDATGLSAWLRKLAPRVRTALVALVGAVVGPLILLGFFVLGAAIGAAHFALWLDLLVAIVATLLFAGLYFACDLNSWSLHPFYKRRLCSAFALKRVGDERSPEAEERDYDRLVPLSMTAPEQQWPTLLVCAAANISDPGATPPGRGVSTFTFSNEAIGGPLVGAMSTEDYEGWLGKNRQRDITLPAAVAMSGAALSPSMGKMTNRAFTFLMALANVRLGVWVPNPRHVEDWSAEKVAIGHDCMPSGSYDRRRKPRPSYLLRELLGKNRVDADFLYVSDGGHYENLGLVELLRRGCMTIYCFDASGGTSFEALGDAIALARSELEVEIDIDPRPLVPVGKRQLASRDCVVGDITYPGVSAKGRLVYARTVLTRDLPWDVHAYHEGDETFPHHSTADQLYTDQKFEAYRALGESAGRHAYDALHVVPGANGGPPTARVGAMEPVEG